MKRQQTEGDFLFWRFCAYSDGKENAVCPVDNTFASQCASICLYSRTLPRLKSVLLEYTPVSDIDLFTVVMPVMTTWEQIATPGVTRHRVPIYT